MIELLEMPNPFSGIFACGTNPEDKDSKYRKPSPGMILDLSEKLSLNLDESILIGDRLSDLIAGSRANLKALYHVKTGHGSKDRDAIKKMTNKKETLFLKNLKHQFIFWKILILLTTDS